MISHQELKRQSDRILNLIANVQELLPEQQELQAHFARYICILCSGFMENVVRHLYSDYVKKNVASPGIRSFTDMSLSRIRNPHTDILRGIAKSFDPVWEIQLKEFMIDERRNLAINYIVTDRNNIAHGKDSDITLSKIKEYHMICLEVTRFIEIQCGLDTAIAGNQEASVVES